MFSARTGFPLHENALTGEVARLLAQGRRLYDLTRTNPTQVGLTAPPDLLALLGEAGSRQYDPVAFGLPAAREAAASDFARRGAEVGPERVFLSASTSEAYAWIFKLLCDPGDAILVPRPSYPLFEYLAKLESVEVDTYPLGFDGEWHALASSVRAAMTPRTRALVVVHPNNPTGSYLKRDEAQALLELCAETDIALVADEVFSDFALAPDPRRYSTFAVDGPALAFAMSGLSKSCGLPQLKLAWTAVSGPEPRRTQALARLELIADTFLSVSTPVQRALPELLSRRESLLAPIRERVSANLETLRESARSAPEVSLLPVEGGWSAVLRVPATLTEEERVLRLLREQQVLIHPGFFFDFPSEAWLVASLLPEPAEFQEGVSRLARSLVL